MFLYTMIFALLAASLLSCLIVLLGKDKWERFLGFAMVSAKINMLIVIWALMTNKSFYLDIALVFIVLSYIGIIVLANYMNQMPNE